MEKQTFVKINTFYHDENENYSFYEHSANRCSELLTMKRRWNFNKIFRKPQKKRMEEILKEQKTEMFLSFSFCQRSYCSPFLLLLFSEPHKPFFPEFYERNQTATFCMVNNEFSFKNNFFFKLWNFSFSDKLSFRNEIQYLCKNLANLLSWKCGNENLTHNHTQHGFFRYFVFCSDTFW
jgi:hypothetical protein